MVIHRFNQWALASFLRAVIVRELPINNKYMHDIKKVKGWAKVKITDRTVSNRHPHIASWSKMQRLAQKMI